MGRDVAADAAEEFPAVFSTKTTRNLLLQLHHPDVAFALIVIEGDRRVRQKRQCFRLEIAQSIEQVLRF